MIGSAISHQLNIQKLSYLLSKITLTRNILLDYDLARVKCTSNQNYFMFLQIQMN
jgi:hypothetical protein